MLFPYKTVMHSQSCRKTQNAILHYLLLCRSATTPSAVSHPGLPPFGSCDASVLVFLCIMLLRYATLLQGYNCCRTHLAFFPILQECYGPVCIVTSQPFLSPVVQECYGPLCNGTSQPAASFSPDRFSPNGLFVNCKQCEAFLSRQRYQKMKLRPFGAIVDAASSVETYCLDCGQLKPAREFCKRSSVRSGRPSICKLCNARRNRVIRAENEASRVSHC